MTQSYNLSQLANNLNTAGQLDATDGLVGAVPPANGGTGLASYAVGDLLYASGATAIAKLPDIATGNVLISGGVSAAPSYGKVGLTTHVNGTLGLANGGTNSTATPVAGSVIVGTGSAMAATAAGTAGQVLTSAGAGTPTWAIVAAPSLLGTAITTTGAPQTFTIPSGVTRLKVTIVGGGGGGGNGDFSSLSGGGGGGGGTSVVWLSGLTPGLTIIATVGLGGSAAAAGGTSSIYSGTQSITTSTATGGSGGSSLDAGSGGSGTGATIIIGGGAGGHGMINGSAGPGGSGGSSTFGGGGLGSLAAGSAGRNYGGGGGGGGFVNVGGAGGQGIVLFEY